MTENPSLFYLNDGKGRAELTRHRIITSSRSQNLN